MVEVVKLEPSFYRADKAELKEMLADAAKAVGREGTNFTKGVVILLDDRSGNYDTSRWIAGLKLSEAVALLDNAKFNVQQYMFEP